MTGILLMRSGDGSEGVEVEVVRPNHQSYETGGAEAMLRCKGRRSAGGRKEQTKHTPTLPYFLLSHHIISLFGKQGVDLHAWVQYQELQTVSPQKDFLVFFSAHSEAPLLFS